MFEAIFTWIKNALWGVSGVLLTLAGLLGTPLGGLLLWYSYQEGQRPQKLALAAAILGLGILFFLAGFRILGRFRKRRLAEARKQDPYLRQSMLSYWIWRSGGVLEARGAEAQGLAMAGFLVIGLLAVIAYFAFPPVFQIGLGATALGLLGLVVYLEKVRPDRAFGMLTLEPYPARAGEVLAVRTIGPSLPDGAKLRGTLACSKVFWKSTVVRGRRRYVRYSQAVWQENVTPSVESTPSGVRLTSTFELPDELPASSELSGIKSGYVWHYQLDAWALHEITTRTFVLPVDSESAADPVPLERSSRLPMDSWYPPPLPAVTGDEQSEARPAAMSPEPQRVREAQQADGATVWILPAGRWFNLAMMFLMAGSIIAVFSFTLADTGTGELEGPARLALQYLPRALQVIALALVLTGVHLLLDRRSIRCDENGLTIVIPILGIGRRTTIPTREIASIDVARMRLRTEQGWSWKVEVTLRSSQRQAMVAGLAHEEAARWLAGRIASRLRHMQSSIQSANRA